MTFLLLLSLLLPFSCRAGLFGSDSELDRAAARSSAALAAAARTCAEAGFAELAESAPAAVCAGLDEGRARRWALAVAACEEQWAGQQLPPCARQAAAGAAAGAASVGGGLSEADVQACVSALSGEARALFNALRLHLATVCTALEAASVTARLLSGAAQLAVALQRIDWYARAALRAQAWLLERSIFAAAVAWYACAAALLLPLTGARRTAASRLPVFAALAAALAAEALLARHAAATAAFGDAPGASAWLARAAVRALAALGGVGARALERLHGGAVGGLGGGDAAADAVAAQWLAADAARGVRRVWMAFSAAAWVVALFLSCRGAANRAGAAAAVPARVVLFVSQEMHAELSGSNVKDGEYPGADGGAESSPFSDALQAIQADSTLLMGERLRPRRLSSGGAAAADDAAALDLLETSDDFIATVRLSLAASVIRNATAAAARAAAAAAPAEAAAPAAAAAAGGGGGGGGGSEEEPSAEEDGCSSTDSSSAK